MERQEELQQFIEDAAAYLRWALSNGESSSAMLRTLTHDICGLERNAECFVPRVSGYALKEQEVI